MHMFVAALGIVIKSCNQSKYWNIMNYNFKELVKCLEYNGK